MVDNWILFGGWALPPAILRPLFVDNTVYFDANTITPCLVDNDILSADWQQRLYDIVTNELPVTSASLGIAGWSTGAMLAWSLANRIKPAAGVFISATPSFCRCRETGFLFGQKSSILRSMRERLSHDVDAVVRDFREQCGIAENPSDVEHFSPDKLVSGLQFLEQATLLPVNRASFPSLFIHGKHDSIIPAGAGRYFCTQAGGTFAEFKGPHAFFFHDPAPVAASIDDFTKRY
jgi:pimeloyl-ACP methyl ester carboxylesterase